MTEQHCTSSFCIVKDGVRGRLFTPPEDAEGIAKVWCPQCIQLSTEINFFSHQTAIMIRKTYKQYMDTELPKEVKLFLEQYTRELIGLLGEEL